MSETTMQSKRSKRGRGQTASLTKGQEIAFQAWRSDALSIMPYFAAPLFSLRVINSPGLGTFAVDAGHRLYVDFDAVTALGPAYCAEALLHECMHLFAGHADLANDLGLRERGALKAWNVAGDASINDDLQDAGCRHVPNPQVHVLPETLGCERNQTPHHYFAKINEMQSAKQRQQITGEQTEAPVLTLMPSRLPAGRVKGQLVTAKASTPFIAATDFTVMLTDADGISLPVSVQGANSDTIGIILDTDLSLGSYEVSVLSGGIAASASLNVVEARIGVDPNHIESGWATPYTVKVAGDLTEFSPTARVTVTDADGNQVPVSTARRLSHTDLRFDLTTRVPDGFYAVTVTDRDPAYDAAPGATVTYTTMLPVGLPHMEIDPNTLPVGYPGGNAVVLSATVSDFGFSTATYIEVCDQMGQPVPGTLGPVTYTSVTTADLPLAVTLDEGTYFVVATNSTPLGTVQAVGSFTVTSENGGGGESSDESQDGEGDGEGEASDSEEAFKGCGSGSGGESAPCELDADDDLDGTAPSAGKIERENARISTAAAIKDHASKHPGSVPGGLVQIAEAVLAPSKTPWEKVLGGFIRRSVAARRGDYDVDRNRRSRRRHGVVLRDTERRIVGRPIYPGKYTPTPSLHIVRDTSGSMSIDDLNAVGREVAAIAKRLSIKGNDLLVTDCDAQVHDAVPYRDAASIREVHGRGGTDMVAGIEAVMSRPGSKPTAIIIISDGYTPWPTERLTVPCIAAIVPQGDDERAAQAAEAVAGDVPDWMLSVVVEPGKS